MALYLYTKDTTDSKTFFVSSKSHTCLEMGNQEEESWFWSQRKAVGKNREEGEEWARTCGQWMHLPTMHCSNEGSKCHSTFICIFIWVLIATTLLLTPWNQAASTNKWDTSAGLSCNCFWVSSSPLMKHTTKHLGHRRLLSAQRFATKDKKKATTPCTALCSYPCICMQKAAHIICTPGKMFAWRGLAKNCLPLWMPALSSCLLINVSPHLAHTQISKKTGIFYFQDQYKQCDIATTKTTESYSRKQEFTSSVKTTLN